MRGHIPRPLGKIPFFWRTSPSLHVFLCHRAEKAAAEVHELFCRIQEGNLETGDTLSNLF